MIRQGPKYNYVAFISYSHRDMAVAKWLQKRLEDFKLPAKIHYDVEAKGRYLRPVFRDQSDLNTGILSEELLKNLAASRFLILICSRHAAQSKWVSDEAKAFVDMGRIDRIIPIIIPDGNTVEQDLFPRSLREYFAANPERMLLGVDVDEIGKERMLVRVVSKILGGNGDDRGREK